MNRIAHLFQSLDELLEDAADRGPEGLRVQRAPLVSLLRDALAELHQDRRAAAGSPRAGDVEWRIRYWEDVLAWLQRQPGRFVDLFPGLHQPPPSSATLRT